MTIDWISQMMAIVVQPVEGKAILPLLKDIAISYPQALYYPFSISSDGIVSNSNLTVLKNLLKNDLLEELIKSLEQLTHPEHRFKVY